jgi:phage terminase large subunit-like protein
MARIIGINEKPDTLIARVTKRLTDNYSKYSAAEILAQMEVPEREAWLGQFSQDEIRTLEYSWDFWARPKQRPPVGDWKRWILTCGRGYGKSRAGAEWVRDKIESGTYKTMALVAANAKDIRRVIVEDRRSGGSGILQVCPPWNMPHYSPTTMSLTWNNPNYKSYGATCFLYSAEEPSSLRGPQHEGAWCDELAKWQYDQETWDMLQYGLRLGSKPQVVITTTPQPTELFRKLLSMSSTVVTTGSTFENRANLSAEFLHDILETYEGTRLGRQELYAEVLADIPGALWNQELVDRAYLPKNFSIPTLRNRVVGVDPQMSFVAGALTGIVVAGDSPAVNGRPTQAYVLRDASMSGTPKQWAQAVVDTYHDYECSLVLAERNQGGELVADNIHNIDRNVRVKLITSTKSKGERAIPVVGRYEQGRVFHLGRFAALESEMLSFVPGDEKKKRSPNRADALVFAIDYLLITGQRRGAGFAIKKRI